MNSAALDQHAGETTYAVEHDPLCCSDDAVRLDSCCPFETIDVTTRRSNYKLIILEPETGEVLVRGGEMFPEFRKASFIGSTVGGSAIRLHTIDVGLRMEFQLGREVIITSAVQALTRCPVPRSAEDLG